MLMHKETVYGRGIEVQGTILSGFDRILTADALDFIAALQRTFSGRRRELLLLRKKIQSSIDEGINPRFLEETASIRTGDWEVAPAPLDLEDRRVEITGPVDRKMMINALNSGAKVFMADFEDANAPTWVNVITGQINLIDAVERTIAYTSEDGKQYRLSSTPATLVVRPRGWHLEEKHVTIDGTPVAASLFDFGLYLFHNAERLLERGTGPYFYLPKLENHLEARLWNDVFIFSERVLGIPHGTIKVTVLIETILAAFEMEEILYELRDYITGLNAGRWDYIFSAIKKFRNRADVVFPDRAQITMTVPFMRAYTELLVHTCHKRGAHAIGGMAAYIPSRKDPQVNEANLARVREDKEREASDGFDGTWVAHPDLVPVARQVFDKVLGKRPHQKSRLRSDVHVSAQQLLDFRVPQGRITEAGVRNNISVTLYYLESWLRGNGAVAIYNLMEDTATAEIARSQLWQWLHNPSVCLEDGRSLGLPLFQEWTQQELCKIQETIGDSAFARGKFNEAVTLLHRLVAEDTFIDFLTEIAYDMLD